MTARDFVHVDDVCDAFLAAAQAGDLPRGAVLNVCSGRQSSIGEIVDVARDLLAVPARPTWGSHARWAWDTNRWVADSALAERAGGWQAVTELRAGLEATIVWFREEELKTGRYGVAV